MPVNNPSYVMGEDVGPSLFVKQDPANDFQALKATLGAEPLGVTHEGTRDAPIPGAAALAAVAGESVRVYGLGEVCEVLVGSLAIVAGDHVAPDANSKAQPSVHGFPYGGKALNASAASGKVRVAIERGVEDKRGTVLTKTADYTLLLRDLGKTISTVGAGATVTIALPAAVVGYEISAHVGAAQELRLDPNGTETIALPSTGVQGAAGKYLTANAAGETVQLKCNVAGTWDVMGFTGTWAAEG